MEECPICKSFDVQVSQQIYDEKLEKIKYYGMDPAKKITYKKRYHYKCNVCGHESYTSAYVNAEYIVFDSPYQVNEMHDVELLALYKSGHESGTNCKICSINSSYYDKNMTKGEKTYLMFIEGEDYPVVLSKETIDEFTEKPDKVYSLAVNTTMSRNR